jgi:hypothetical protein
VQSRNEHELWMASLSPSCSTSSRRSRTFVTFFISNSSCGRSCPAAAWQLQRLPGALLVFRSAFLTAASTSVEHVQLPSGGSIVVDSVIKARLTLLSGLAAEGTVLYAPVGSGWHFAYRAPITTRHSWFFAPDVIRAYDRAEFVRSLDEISSVVTCAPQGSLTVPLSSVFPLPREISAEVYSRLELRKTEAGCRVYRVRRRG